MKRTHSSFSRSALALALVTAFLIGLIGASANAQVPANPKACSDAVAQASKQANLSPEVATPQNMAAACKNANNRAALAMRNFSHRFVMAKKIEEMPAAPDGLAKQCPGRLMAVSKTLHLNPQFANPKDVQTACGIAKGRPVLATRNFLDRFVVSAKIAPSVIAENKDPAPKPGTPPQKNDPAIAKCAGVVANVAKTLAISPKEANENDLNTSCAKGKAQPQMASFVFLNHFLGSNKITPETKIPEGLAKQCPGRVTSAGKGLHLDAPLLDPKRIVAACKHFKDHAAIALRDLLARHLKAHKMI